MRATNDRRLLSMFAAYASGLIAALGFAPTANASTIPLSYSFTSYSSPTDPDHPSFFVKSLTFTLPPNFTQAALTITSLKFDDRGVVQLNGTTITSSGYQPIPGGCLNGQMVLSEGASPVPYTFAHEYSDTLFAAITTNFKPGLNTLDFIVNDTSGGINFRDGLLSDGYYWYTTRCFDSSGCPYSEVRNGKTYYRGNANPPTGVQFAGQITYSDKKRRVGKHLARRKFFGLSVTPLLAGTAEPVLSKVAVNSVAFSEALLVETPIPGTASLFAAAMAGLGLAATRRKRPADQLAAEATY